eukprot:5785708-Pyramimonas_sp.AAC.1
MIRTDRRYSFAWTRSIRADCRYQRDDPHVASVSTQTARDNLCESSVSTQTEDNVSNPSHPSIRHIFRTYIRFAYSFYGRCGPALDCPSTERITTPAICR